MYVHTLQTEILSHARFVWGSLRLTPIIHIIFVLSVQYIIITSWDSPLALMPIGLVEFHMVHRRSSGIFHRESTLRFIPKGCVVPRVLIHPIS